MQAAFQTSDRERRVFVGVIGEHDRLDAAFQKRVEIAVKRSLIVVLRKIFLEVREYFGTEIAYSRDLAVVGFHRVVHHRLAAEPAQNADLYFLHFHSLFMGIFPYLHIRHADRVFYVCEAGKHAFGAFPAVVNVHFVGMPPQI